ncbi:hypothetical protein Tco_0115277 [Tanacetum coccineum]
MYNAFRCISSKFFVSGFIIRTCRSHLEKSVSGFHEVVEERYDTWNARKCLEIQNPSMRKTRPIFLRLRPLARLHRAYYDNSMIKEMNADFCRSEGIEKSLQKVGDQAIPNSNFRMNCLSVSFVYPVYIIGDGGTQKGTSVIYQNSESSASFGGRRQKRRGRATFQQPFKLRTKKKPILFEPGCGAFGSGDKVGETSTWRRVGWTEGVEFVFDEDGDIVFINAFSNGGTAGKCVTSYLSIARTISLWSNLFITTMDEPNDKIPKVKSVRPWKSYVAKILTWNVQLDIKIKIL